MAVDTTLKTKVNCSFCGKSQADVAKLIAGPGVYICDECVVLCDNILDNQPLPEFPAMSEKSDDEVLRDMVRIHGSHAQIDTAVATIVKELRRRGVTWSRIGEALGMSRQSAWERFSGEE